MKMSMFQWVLLSVFGVAGLAGLVAFATYTSTGGSDAIGAVVIWGTLPADDITNALQAAVHADQSLKGVTYVRKEAATLPQDLAAAIATGAPPDLVLASHEELLALAPFLDPIPSSTLSTRTFNDSFALESTLLAAPAGGYYGVPVGIDPMMLFYNRDILASSGVPAPPTTWEALTGLTARVVELTSTRQVTRGLVDLGGYDNIHDARGVLSTLFLQLGVPVTSRDSTGRIVANLGLGSTDASGGLPPGQSILRFYTQFSDPGKISYTWNASLPDSLTLFATGDLALHLGFASEARFLKQSSPNLVFDVAPVPQPATATTKATYGLLYSLSLVHSAKNGAGALKAALLFGNAQIDAALASATGLAPANVTALATAQADPVASGAATAALYAHGWLSPIPANTDTIFSTMINDVITGRAELQTALSFGERSLASALPQ